MGVVLLSRRLNILEEVSAAFDEHCLLLKTDSSQGSIYSPLVVPLLTWRPVLNPIGGYAASLHSVYDGAEHGQCLKIVVRGNSPEPGAFSRITVSYSTALGQILDGQCSIPVMCTLATTC